MEASEYLGGIGGKLRRKPHRRVAATPYDRPATAARTISRGRWLSKLVDPASRFIASSASRLFSSMFRKQLTAPTAEKAPGEVSQFQSAQEVVTAVSPDLPIEQPENEAENKNVAANNLEDNVVLEFGQLIKEKSFTKAQYEHLIDVLRSRTTDLDTTNSGANGEKIDDVIVPQPATRTDNFSLCEDHVTDGHAVTPVELAKEYMRAKVSSARVSNDSPLSQNWQSHLFHKNKKVQANSHYGAKKLDLKIPRSLAQLPAMIPESSYLTPRSLGRSGTYKMEGSLYAKSKVEESLKDDYAGTFSVKTPCNEHAGGQVLKRSSSTLYSDFRSTCPIRRVRQKLGINSSNRIMHSVLPGNSEPCSLTVKKGFQDPSQNQCPHNLDAREETEGNKILNKAVASGSVQSREMENKILQGLDKLLPSPKRKSMKLKDNPVEESPSYGIHTHPKGTGDALCDKQGRLDMLQENGPSTASMHDNNVVDAGVSDYIAVSGNQKPAFQIGEFKDTVVNNIEGSSTISKYSKDFSFPSINVSFTSELPPTPTLPGPFLEKSMVQKVQSTTPLVISGSMEASTTQSDTNRDSSHAVSTLENCTRLNQVSSSCADSVPALHFEPTASIVSSTLAPQISSGNLEGKPSDASPFILNSASQDTAFKFGSNSVAPVAVSRFASPSSDMDWAAPTVSSSEVGSAPSSLLPESGRSQSALPAKMLSVGTLATQQTSDVSASQFQSTSENRANNSFVLAPPIVSSSGSSSAAAALSFFPSSGNKQAAIEPILPDANNTKFGFGSTKFNNSASINLGSSTKTSPGNNITGFAGTFGNRANDGSILPTFGVPSFASSSAASSLFPHAVSSTNSFSKLGSGLNNLGSSLTDAKTSPSVNFTGFGMQSTQIQSGIPHISNCSMSQFPSSSISNSTFGTNVASSSSLGSSPFGATDTHSKLFSSFSTGAGSSSISAAAAATTLPLAATPGLFGSNSLPPTFLVSSASSGGFGSTSVQSTIDAPFVFKSSSNPAFSASPAGTSFASGRPAVGFSFRTTRDDQLSIKQSQTVGAKQSTGSMVQQFSQSGTSSAATVFSAPAVHSTQQNSFLPSIQPQSQVAGSAQIPQGGTFAMGSSGGGNGDKSGRRIIKIRRDKRKK
ncbi:nuclear pore complex protein NUP1-like isoform X2 [Zingiber officinale]|uniref:nuclear pore complex protein NUP1-like isoform X2 n=1 Tax=Zingiber officinale TaxID=94328 RepID=UPI001C4DB72B|nr:nuclear pore complex protein NUP1-like isoform X2 [Zingiber officinale]